MGGSQSKTFMVIGYDDTYIDFEDDWSREGSSRRVYRGRFRGDSHLQGKMGVVKVYKELYSDPKELFTSDKPEFTWEADDRAYKKAHEIAQKFNAHYDTTKPIEFIKPEFTEVDPRTAIDIISSKERERFPEKITVAVERYLDGEYDKFLGNAGYVNPKQMATPAAFSHFSYHVTGGEVLVCDLQGVRTSTSYKLTDPAVHNSGLKPLKYGPSDLGKLGIVMFFAYHKCNVLCEGLKKPKGFFNCTTGKSVTFDKIAAEMPEGSVADTYLVGDPSTGALVDLREILSRPVQKSTMQPRQLGMNRSQIEQMQKDIKLEEE